MKKSYQQKTVLNKNHGLFQIDKYMNIKIQKEIIVVKCISVIKVTKIIYKFCIQVLVQNTNYLF